MSGKVALNLFTRNRSWFLTIGRQKPLRNVARSYGKDAGKGGRGKGAPPPQHAPDASRAEGASRLPHPTAGLEGDPPFLLPLLWGAPLAPLAAPRPLPGFRSGRERRLGGSLGGGLAMRVRVVGVRPQGGLCSSSPLPPPLPAWGRADPRVTGEAARRARAEA